MSAPRSNAGTPWTAEHDRVLLAAFAGGNGPLATVADRCGRTHAAVLNRLVRLGHLLHTRDGYFLPHLYATLSDAKEPHFTLSPVPDRHAHDAQ